MEKGISSYRQIFKSTTVIGSAQILTIILGIIRTKVLTLFLGAEGVAIGGIYQSIVEMARNATGFGINISGVKDIAQSKSLYEVSRSSLILRKWALATGFLGMLLVLLFSPILDFYSFGDNSHTFEIASLSIVLFLSSVSSAQTALLQGLRLIVKMAKVNVLGALVGLLFAMPLYYWLGKSGIALSMILAALGTLGISWWYTNSIKMEQVQLTSKEVFRSGLGMAKLGFFVVITGFLATLSLYIVRIFILSNADIDAVGYFQAVWTISVLYLNIVLNSCLADFMPRLCSVYSSLSERNQLINEQLRVVLLIATPMLIGMFLFSPLVLRILYSDSFFVADPILKWHVLSSFPTLVSWPVSLLFLAGNKGEYNIVTTFLRYLIILLLVYFAWQYIGFKILGYSFFLGSLAACCYIILLTSIRWKFSFSGINKKYIFLFGISFFFIASIEFLLSGVVFKVINGCLFIILSGYCLYELNHIIGIKELILKKIKKKN